MQAREDGALAGPAAELLREAGGGRRIPDPPEGWVWKLRVSGTVADARRKLGQDQYVDLEHDVGLLSGVRDFVDREAERSRTEQCRRELRRTSESLLDLIDRLTPSHIQRQLREIGLRQDFSATGTCLPSWARGAHVFVSAEIADEIEEALEAEDLTGYHVVVSEKYRGFVDAALAAHAPDSGTANRGSKQPKVRREDGVALPAMSPSYADFLMSVYSNARKLVVRPASWHTRLTHSTGSQPRTSEGRCPKALGRASGRKRYKLIAAPRCSQAPQAGIARGVGRSEGDGSGSGDGHNSDGDGHNGDGHSSDGHNGEGNNGDGNTVVVATDGNGDLVDAEHAESETCGDSRSVSSLPDLTSLSRRDMTRRAKAIVSSCLDGLAACPKSQTGQLPKSRLQFSKLVATKLEEFATDVVQPSVEQLGVEEKLATALQNEAGTAAEDLKSALWKFLAALEESLFDAGVLLRFMKLHEGGLNIGPRNCSQDGLRRALSESTELFIRDFHKALQISADSKKSEWKALKARLPTLINEGVHTASERICHVLAGLVGRAMRAAGPEQLAAAAWARQEEQARQQRKAKAKLEPRRRRVEAARVDTASAPAWFAAEAGSHKGFPADYGSHWEHA